MLKPSPSSTRPDAGLDAVAIDGLELLEELGLPLDEGVEGAVGGGLDGGGDFGKLVLNRGGVGEGAPHLRDEGLFGGEAGLLVEVAQAPAAEAGFAFVRLQFVLPAA